jgi:hypothetical protein
MKYFILTSIIILLSFHSNAQPTPPEGMLWVEVPALSDEFDSWDASKWFKSLWNYGEPVQMLDKNSGVSDGKLWIMATLDSTSTRWFETSRVMSKTRISYPMYTECSMRTAHISAYNTFWMNNGNSENRDEIDICENNSKPSVTSQTDRPYTMYSQYFIVVNNDTEREHGNFDNRNLSNDNPMKGVKWNEDYHTLGVWWKDENNIQFYLDGEEAGHVTSSRDFTRELNIIWDLWTIDATWSGGIASKDDLLDSAINTMYVDWIHTYTLEADPSIGIDVPPTATDISVFPDPVDNELFLRFPGELNRPAQVKIYDIYGHLHVKQQVYERKNSISVQELAAGIYFVNIEYNNSISTKPIIKE